MFERSASLWKERRGTSLDSKFDELPAGCAERVWCASRVLDKLSEQAE